MNVDFGLTSNDYGTHRAEFPAALYDHLELLGVEVRERLILDIGTGTGCLARGLAERGARVVGLDRAHPMLVEALRQWSTPEDPARPRYVRARAEGCPFRSRSFELVTAGQCWHWFETDQVCSEIRRVLVENGRLVICSFDWVPEPGNVVEATEALILKHNPSWSLGGGDGLHTEYVEDVSRNGFRDVRSLCFDIAVTYTHAAWRGRIRASAGVAASLPPRAVEAFDRELDEHLRRSFPDQPLAVPHRSFITTCLRP